MITLLTLELKAGKVDMRIEGLSVGTTSTDREGQYSIIIVSSQISYVAIPALLNLAASLAFLSARRRYRSNS